MRSRIVMAGMVVALAAAPALSAQGERAHTMVVASPEQIRDAIAERMKEQNFEVQEANRKMIVFAQDRGTTMLTSGVQLKVRLEVEFQLKARNDSTEILLSKETLVGAERGGDERRVEQDLKKNRASFQALLDQVHDELAATAGGSDGTR